MQFQIVQGFKHFSYMPLEVGVVMASCEARLLKQKIISGPFTAKEIAEGALQDHLIQEDYDAPLKVNIILLQVTCDSPTHPTIPFYFSLTTSDSLVVATDHSSFHFREEHDWQPRLMLLRHQPGSLYPSSLRRFPKKNRRPGKEVIPSFLLFQLFPLPTKEIFNFLF